MPKDTSTSRLKNLLRRAPAERLTPIFERHGVPTWQGADALAEAICLDGSNTIASLFRWNEGVSYREVLGDVADKMDVTVGNTEDDAKVEQRLLETLIERHYRNASPAEREEIDRIVGDASERHSELTGRVVLGSFTGILTLLVNTIGREAVVQVVQSIILKMIARRAGALAAQQAARAATYAVPILNIVMIGWTVIDIAGPAFRKTVPTIIEIALLRLEFNGG